MKLLVETNENIDILTEQNDENGEKNYYIVGPMMSEDTPNKNGRIYPGVVLDNALPKYINEYVKESRAYGELNHPTEPSINLDRASHIITELKKEGKNWVGKARILKNLPMGKIVKGLIDENCKIGTSSRALGSLKEQNGKKIVEAIILTTPADIVANPSNPGSFPTAIMEEMLIENYEWILEGESWVKKEIVYDLIAEHKQHTREQREAAFLKLWSGYIDTLKR